VILWKVIGLTFRTYHSTKSHVTSCLPLVTRHSSLLFRVGHGLNLGNGGWKGILARTERIVKSEW